MVCKCKTVVKFPTPGEVHVLQFQSILSAGTSQPEALPSAFLLAKEKVTLFPVLLSRFERHGRHCMRSTGTGEECDYQAVLQISSVRLKTCD